VQEDSVPLIRLTPLNFCSDTIPTEGTTSLAVNAFLVHRDPVFHVIAREYYKGLIEKVYHNITRPAESDLCELFAVAAAGCHYSNISTSESSISNFIQHCSVRLFNTTRSQNLQSMRIYLGLSLCWDPARSSTARILICECRTILPDFTNSRAASGLQHARWDIPNTLPTQQSELNDWIQRAKTFRTLSFCE
jgi:hypothetical protein